MIRFLQQDNKAVKVMFWIIIVASSVMMVIFLVPGIFSGEYGGSSDTYATVHSPGFLGRYLGSSSKVTEPDVERVAKRMLQQEQLPPQLMPYIEQRAGQALIQRAILLKEANRMGFQVSDADLVHALETGPFGRALFPDGKFVGQDRYDDFVENYFHTSTHDFEQELKMELEIDRLQSAVTGAVTVSDKQVRDAYLKQGTKIKFKYAVLSPDKLRQQINPSESQLQAFFKENAARYKDAIPETRKIEYVAFSQSEVPGPDPQVTPQEIEQYYQEHQKNYQVPEEVKVRHILIAVPHGASAEVDAAAKKKAEGLLAQLKAGANFAALAKKYSDDPGSKAQGGQLGFIQRGATVPAFEKAAFALKPGQLSGVVKTQFGYHIILCEAKQEAHTKPLKEVQGEILATLTRNKEQQQEQNFAQQLAKEAGKSGLAKAAAANHMKVTTTDFVPSSATLPGMADSTKLMTAAFAANQGAAPAVASTGSGYAVFQVESIQAAHAPEFDKYKSHVLDDFRQQQLPQLMARKTTELAEAAQSDGSLAQAAKQAGATVETSDLVDRSAQVPEIGQLSTAAPQIFDLNPGQISQGINTGQSGVVVKIEQKQPPSAAEIAQNMGPMRDQLLQQKRQEIFAVFVTNLTQSYEKQGLIRINRHVQKSPQQQGFPQQGLPG